MAPKRHFPLHFLLWQMGESKMTELGKFRENDQNKWGLAGS